MNSKATFTFEGFDGEVSIEKSIDLPSDDQFDEIAVQLLVSDGEPVAIGTYRESRRGGLDTEVVEHVAHLMPDDVLQKGAFLIRHDNIADLKQIYKQAVIISGKPLLIVSSGELPDFIA